MPNTLSEEHPSYGFKKIFYNLRNEGFGWNHKKVYGVYKKLGLNILRKKKERLAFRERKNLEVPSSYNEVWSMDFMSDVWFNSRRFRTLNIIDDYNREAVWIEIIPAELPCLIGLILVITTSFISIGLFVPNLPRSGI